VTFATPWALLGLALVPVLVLLERRRRRPRARTWPSLLLWRAIGAVAAPRRRRLDPLLLAECIAVVLASLAAAEPRLAPARGDRGEIVVLLDDGPHLDARRADGTTARAATRREIARIPAPVRVVAVQGDLAAAAAALPDAIVATTRPDPGLGDRVVLGLAPQGRNVGIAAVAVEDDRLWFALATDGDTRQARVRLGREERVVPIGEGITTARVDAIEVLDPDNYDGDDTCRLRPVRLGARDETGSRLVDAALTKAGLPTVPGNDLVITTRGGAPLAGVVRGSDCIAHGDLFAGLLLDECEWRDPRAGEDGGALLSYRGRALAAWRDARTLWLGLPVDREWDDHYTLAVLIERAKRARVLAGLGAGEALVGEAIAAPAPAFVDTRGVDRPWDGTLPPAGAGAPAPFPLRPLLGWGAVAVLAAYLVLLARADR